MGCTLLVMLHALLAFCLRPSFARATTNEETLNKLESPGNGANMLKCYIMENRKTGGCYTRKRSHLIYNESLSDTYQIINSSTVTKAWSTYTKSSLLSLESPYPNNVKCIWTFQLGISERASIICSDLDLDRDRREKGSECGIGVCNRDVIDSGHRDYIQMVGEIKRDRCETIFRDCHECAPKKNKLCNGEKRNRENYVTFCGKWNRANEFNVTKPRADFTYSETNNGNVKLIFESNESRRGTFSCKYFNRNKLNETRNNE